jgi:uncharacterized membrane protein SirB2
MSYLILKQLHITCVLLSGTGFLLRGIWMLTDSPWLQRPVVRRLPHLVDTVLLASAIAMAVISSQNPFATDWLTAKLVGLLLYIGCGTMALKRARSKAARCAFPGRRAERFRLHRVGCREPQPARLRHLADLRPRRDGPGKRLASLVSHQFSQARSVENPDFSLMDGEQAFFLEARKSAADGFQLEAEIAADLVTRHAQVEFGR